MLEREPMIEAFCPTCERVVFQQETAERLCPVCSFPLVTLERMLEEARRREGSLPTVSGSNGSTG
jgi:uncharacterized Zn finger protein (UPF0148 family)